MNTKTILVLVTFAVLAAAGIANQFAMVRMAGQKADSDQLLTDSRVALYMMRAKAHELRTKLAYSKKLRQAEERARMRMLTVTAYSADVAETDDTPYVTASNNRVRPGIVAVSRDLFRKGWVFGRKIYIKGLGVFIIDDLMHTRKTNQIDVFMGGKGDALQFGRKTLEVYLLDT